MPCYDWKCTKCGHEFEKIVSKPDPEQKIPCPKCGALCETFMPLGRNQHLKFLFNYMEPTDS